MCPLPAAELGSLDPYIWRACAGNNVQIPTLHSRVYYFPQGHAEQCYSPPVFSPLVFSNPAVLCRVVGVRFLADQETDEVLAKIMLEPVPRFRESGSVECARPGAGAGDGSEAQENNKVMAFIKILTSSDANNGGGFSVPRFCADCIFPPLNFQDDPPVQALFLTDLRGTKWEFRHIYRGTPRRHLLTTGWSKFVNDKKLVAGDSVVFMKRDSDGKLFIGVRRDARWRRNADKWDFRSVAAGAGKAKEVGGVEGFSRTTSGRVRPEAVTEAAELAAQGMPFEVVYYPRTGSSEFVVKAEVVEEALSVFWTAGMRVKMAMETEDSSKTSLFQGTVSATLTDNGHWRGSPWRALQVTWDEPEVLQNVMRVNPWQVELLMPTTPFSTALPPAKRFRIAQSSEIQNDGEGEIFLPMAATVMGVLSPSLLNHNTFPAGMQGARQDSFYASSLSNLTSENTHQMCTMNSLDNIATKSNAVSTELNIGSSQSDNLSPDSQGSVDFFGTKLARNQDDNSMKFRFHSFRLLGKDIQIMQPVQGNCSTNDCTEDGGRRIGCSQDGGKRI